MKRLIPLLLVPPLILACLFGYVLYRAPRMKVQHHIREFQMELPNIPAGTMAVHATAPLPTAFRAAGLANPLPQSTRNLDRGRVYYQYYCAFCHGENGSGDGPVGQSYTPKPADLRSANIAAYRDGELLRSMLTGTGHEPVLARVVAPEHRWYLMLMVRSLAKNRRP